MWNKQTKQNQAVLLIAATVLASGLAVTTWAKKPEKPPGGGGGKEARYTIVDLGSFGGWGGIALGINESGQVVGYSFNADDLQRAFLVTPEDSDNDGVPDTWFRDDDGDEINDLMIDLGTLGLGNGSYVWSVATGINDLGQVVGYSVTDESVESAGGYLFYVHRAFLITPEDSDSDGVPDTWFVDDGEGRNALMIDLGRLIGEGWGTPSSCSRAHGISNSGHVVGYVSRTDNGSSGRGFIIAPEDTDDDNVPDTWFRDDNGDGYNDLMIDLGPLWAHTDPTIQAWSQVWGVNDSGQVVGKSFGDYVNGERWYRNRGFLITPENTDGDGVLEWFLDDGLGGNALMIELGPLSRADSSIAYAINSSGQVVGTSSEYAALWEVDEQGNVTLTDLGTVKGKKATRPIGINDASQVVGGGLSINGRDSSGSWTAFLWENGTMTKLIDLLANSEGIGDLIATGINESGEIVGSIYGDGYRHVYIALPIIPVP